jgi:hypothetical protein
LHDEGIESLISNFYACRIAAVLIDKFILLIKQIDSDFAYKSFRHLASRSTTVEVDQTQQVDLVEGRKLVIGFKQVDKDGRVRLQLSIPGVVNTTVSLAPGGSVVLGGPALPSGDGVLFVPVTLSSAK